MGPSIAGIDAATSILGAAREAAANAWAPVLAADDSADNGIGRVRDEMYNALGRPKQSAELDRVFPGGIGTYTNGDPRRQPLLMQVLHSRLLATEHAKWTAAQRTAWAVEIESLRVPYQAALDVFNPLEAAQTVAEAAYRSATRSAQARLVSFKRDLKSLGLTEAQIHEIIPDAETRGGGGGSARSGGSSGGGSAIVVAAAITVLGAGAALWAVLSSGVLG